MQDAEVAGPGTKSVAREVWFGSDPERNPTHPSHPRAHVRPGAQHGPRLPHPSGDASSIIPSGRSGREDKGAWPSSGEAVLALADAGNRDPDLVAALQEL